MNNFDKYFNKVIALEGGFTLHKNQTEEAQTYAGIYRKVHPTWAGWRAIDVGSRPDTALVKEFYKEKYWDKFDGIDNEKRYILFEYGVNAGVFKAAKLAQAVCGITIDGVIGDKSRAAINSTDNFVLLYTVARIKHYNDLAAKDKYRPYLRGWINRALEAVS